MPEPQPNVSGQSLAAGTFYGTVQCSREHCGAIFTDLSHSHPRKLPAHAHELPFFELLLAGFYGERFGHQDRQFRPFTILFRPAGVFHQDEIGPTEVKIFEIEVRPSWRQRLKDCSASLEAGYDDCHGGELLWLGMKLFYELHSTADELVIESLLAESLWKAARTRDDFGKPAPRWLTRVVEKLTVEHSERIALDDLRGEAGVHPVHLSRVFRKFMGQGIGEYVRRLRIRSACEQLLDPDLPMAEISLVTGFADQSHFTRSFKKITGMTPARFRVLVSKGNVPRGAYLPNIG